MISDAVISPCGRYRYSLVRAWGSGGRLARFVMLNPSTADATADDPTIRRCIGFARLWGLDGLAVVNLYALRSTDPAGLWAADVDPVGPDNDRHLWAAAVHASDAETPLVAAWGVNAKASRIEAVLDLPGMHRLQALGITKAGQPRHPLYLRRDAQLTRWTVPA